MMVGSDEHAVATKQARRDVATNECTRVGNTVLRFDSGTPQERDFKML